MTWASARTEYADDEQTTAAFERQPGAAEQSQVPPTATHATVTTAVGDRCSSCGTALAPDQRYCLECGERRGKARFPTAQTTTVETVTRTTRAPGRPRVSSSGALIAGVATLLIAMGVGVLIGRTGGSTKASGPAQVITVGGGGGAAASSTPTTSSPSTGTSKGHKSHKPKTTGNPNAGLITKTVKNLPPATVTQGQSCNQGTAGCQGGKFTGNFFGP